MMRTKTLFSAIALSAMVLAAPQAAPPRISSVVTGTTSHGPYSGTPTTTGAVQASTTLSKTIAPLPPNPTHTYYNPKGVLLDPAPMPYQPHGMQTAVPFTLF